MMRRANKWLLLALIAVLIAVCNAHEGTDKPHSKKLQQDDEDFEEEEAVQEKYVAPAAPIPLQEHSVTPEELPEPEGKRTWVLEITYVSVIIIYAINYILGRSKNQQLVTAWGNAVQEVFVSNFSKFGEHPNFMITKESQHLYTISCGGRVNCHGAQVTVELKKRQDLLSTLMGFVVSSKPDLLTFDVAMEDSAPTFLFAIINKKEKQTIKDFPEITKMGALINTPALQNYTVYTDAPETYSSILTNDATQALKVYDSYVRYIYYSDQSGITPKYKKILRYVYRLPGTKEEMVQLVTLMKLSMHHIDTFANIKLSAQAIAKNEKLRAKIAEPSVKEAQALREEAIQKKKAEQRKLEAEKYEKMTPEAQRKWEEKKYKKELKEKHNRFKVKYG